MGNEEQGGGNRERDSRNECTAVTRLRIPNGGQKKEKETKGSVTAINVSLYRLCPSRLERSC